jgi:hypothetical protein
MRTQPVVTTARHRWQPEIGPDPRRGHVEIAGSINDVIDAHRPRG